MSDPARQPSDSTRLPVSDSPWLWLALFSGMSLVALVLINHKHTLRQTRLEQRYANRVQAQATRQAAKPASEAEAAIGQNRAQIEAEYRDQPEGTAMSGAQPRSSLVPLMVACAVVCAVALAGLWRQRMLVSPATQIEQHSLPR